MSQVSSRRCVRGNHTLMFFSLFYSPLFLKINIFLRCHNTILGEKNLHLEPYEAELGGSAVGLSSSPRVEWVPSALLVTLGKVGITVMVGAGSVELGDQYYIVLCVLVIGRGGYVLSLV